MIFTEVRFLFFFLVVFLIHWILRSNHSRKIWLLFCSYVFYAAWDWRFLSLIIASTLVDYAIGLGMAVYERNKHARKRLLTTSMIFNLGMLGVFKYFNFFIDSAAGLLKFVGLAASPSTLQIILPVGISFYTFQTMSYTIDVYKRQLAPRKSLLDVALFVGFFPQLVAGPIVRAIEFLPQLRREKTFRDIAWRSCIVLFMLGFVKKACVSDNLSIYVDAYFADPHAYDTASAFIGVMLYSIQIYCDFSGYSDMAIATAAMLGYQFCTNFSFPYFAPNIQEFWRRWHISLSSWLRDYLYIMLGGSRGSKLFRYRNLMLTMLLGGLWHGAAWKFIFWGLLHGVALVIHREWSQQFQSSRWRNNKLWRLFSIVITFYWVSLAWIFFRAETFAGATFIAGNFIGLGGTTTNGISSLSDRLWIVIVGLLAIHIVCSSGILQKAATKCPRWVFATCLGASIAVIGSLMSTEISPFIYFQF